MMTSFKHCRDGRQTIPSAAVAQAREDIRTPTMSAEEDAYVNQSVRQLMRSGVVLGIDRMQREIQNARAAFASIQAAKQIWPGYCGPACSPNTPLYRTGRRA